MQTATQEKTCLEKTLENPAEVAQIIGELAVFAAAAAAGEDPMNFVIAVGHLLASVEMDCGREKVAEALEVGRTLFARCNGI